MVFIYYKQAADIIWFRCDRAMMLSERGKFAKCGFVAQICRDNTDISSCTMIHQMFRNLLLLQVLVRSGRFKGNCIFEHIWFPEFSCYCIHIDNHLDACIHQRYFFGRSSLEIFIGNVVEKYHQA